MKRYINLLTILILIFIFFSCSLSKSNLRNESDGIDSTILNKNKKISFDLLLLLTAYHNYYLDYPLSINDLIIYDSLANTGDEMELYGEVTSFLKNNKEKIAWKSSDYDVVALINNDTLVHYQGGDSHSLCYSPYPQEKFIFRFFDTLGYYAYSINRENEFKHGLMELASSQTNYTKKGTELYIMAYSRSDGLQYYCNNDNSTLNPKWFSLLNNYVHTFSNQNNLGKVIFGTPNINTE